MHNVIKIIHDQKNQEIGYMLECPGCGEMHLIYVQQPSPSGFKWTFNNNLEKPTFSPSCNIKYKNNICHFFITDGKIKFCNDSTHSLSGKEVSMCYF
jgi:hypothetical protein